MVSTYPDGDNAHTGFSPPKAESSFELSNSSEASLTGGLLQRGHPTITPLIGRPLGSSDPGAIAIDPTTYRKADSRRGRGRTPRPESSDEDEEYEDSAACGTDSGARDDEQQDCDLPNYLVAGWETRYPPVSRNAYQCRFYERQIAMDGTRGLLKRK